MSEPGEPHQQSSEGSELSTTRRNLKAINRKYFDPATWEPLFSTKTGRDEYGKFATLMVERIQSNESSYQEIRSFVHLAATEDNWDFMNLATPYLPELKEQRPYESENYGIALLFFLQRKFHRRRSQEVQNAIPACEPYENGLSPAEEQYLRRSLFGPDQGAVDSSSVNRLFNSILELGYPQPALHQLIREAKERGTDIERSGDGLSADLQISSADNRPDQPSSSSSYSHGSSTPRKEVPDTSAESPDIPRSSAEPPRNGQASANGAKTLSGSTLDELVIESAVDSVNPPVLTIPHQTTTSRGELPELDSTDIIKASRTRQGESPNHRQTLNGPPGIHRGTPEREEFKAYYEKPASEFLNYFQDAKQAPDPRTEDTNHTTRSDRPKSPSVPDQDLMAVRPESLPTRTDPIDIPYRG